MARFQKGFAGWWKSSGAIGIIEAEVIRAMPELGWFLPISAQLRRV